MSWEAIEWTPADSGLLEAVAPLGSMWSLVKSALEESISASIMGPATIETPSIARVEPGLLPAEFEPVATFELLGVERRGLWAAFAPDGGTVLADAPQTPAGLQAVMLEGFDAVVEAMVGEGLSIGPGDPALQPAGQLLLVRLPIRDASGAGIDGVFAIDESVPGELAAHVVALQALNESPAPAARSSQPVLPPAAPVAAAPVAAPPAPVAPPVAAPIPPPAPTVVVRPIQLPELPASPASANGHNIELLLGVNLEVSVEIGRTRLPIRDVLALAPGSVVELDKLAGEKVDVLVNGRPIASGEVVVVDENFGVRITDVVSRQHRILSADSSR